LTRKETKFCCVGREQKHKGEKKKKKRRKMKTGAMSNNQDKLRMACGCTAIDKFECQT